MSAATLAEQADAMRAALGDGQPATDALLVEFAEQIRDRRAHDHASAGPDWDWYCLNASGWLGDKSPAVLRRLLDAEAEVERLRTERDQFADRVDTLTSVARSNKQAYAEAVATVARLEQQRVQQERIANAERDRVAELEQQLTTARERIADELHRARLPQFPVGETPAEVARTVRAVDVHLIEMADGAPYWVPEGDAAADDRTPPAYVMACAQCDGSVGWVFCPTGGWWAHAVHPADGHDAEPIPAAALAEGGECS